MFLVFLWSFYKLVANPQLLGTLAVLQLNPLHWHRLLSLGRSVLRGKQTVLDLPAQVDHSPRVRRKMRPSRITVVSGPRLLLHQLAWRMTVRFPVPGQP